MKNGHAVKHARSRSSIKVQAKRGKAAPKPRRRSHARKPPDALARKLIAVAGAVHVLGELPIPKRQHVTWDDAVHCLDAGSKALNVADNKYEDQDLGIALARAASFLRRVRPVRAKGDQRA